MSLSLVLPVEVQLRPSCAADQPFLQQLFNGSRQEFWQMGLPPELTEQLLQQQFLLQQESYRQQAPEAAVYILMHQGEPFGQFTLAWQITQLWLMDIVLLPAMQGQGYGSAVLQALQKIARRENIPLTLSVREDNHRARQLYLRHGFVPTGQQGIYLGMQWLASLSDGAVFL